MQKETAKQRIAELVETYKKNEREGKLSAMSEDDTKAVFIEPLFGLLGWKMGDVDEVWRNRSASTGKRPDYEFKISGVTRFFVEAKAASAPLEEKEAWQAINYAYMKSVPWAVLTNFEQLIIYSSEWKSTKSEESRFLRFGIDDYIPRFEDLWLLSREGVSSGEINKYAERVGRRAKRDPVTKTLFSDFMGWRARLSKNIAEHDPKNKFTKDYLDEVVQRFLNRLVFIRTCEDRGIENERLRAAVRECKSENKRKLMSYVKDIFSDFNEDYDSDIFFSHAAGDLLVDNEVIEGIIDELYESPEGVRYDFAAIDADVLGNIYEQYLATILRKGGGVLEREAKRKEMGIYYTPTYIVDYIVKNTLGELVSKAKKPEELERIKVLDPACGSGSFLIRAFGALNEAYLRKNGGDHEMLGENVSRNAYSILTKNLYGVDLDRRAIEIAELNLLLRAATRKGRLPPLSDNIKHGNSLISGNEEELKKYFGDHWREKHPFNWDEQFADVMKEGGFDVVIGNPPYINAIQLTKDSPESKEYWQRKYQTAKGAYDIYILFFEQAMNLVKEDGLVSFITPNKYLSSPYGFALRKLVAEKYTLKQVVDLAAVDVFGDPSVYPVITIIQKRKPTKEYSITVKRVSSQDIPSSKKLQVSSKYLSSLPEYLWGALLSKQLTIIDKCFSNYVALEAISEVQATSTAAEADVFSSLISDSGRGAPVINSGTIDRYGTSYGFADFTNKGEKLRKPKLDVSDKHVSGVRKALYSKEKLIFAKLALRIEAFWDKEGKFASLNTNCVHSPRSGVSLSYLAAILNSKLLSFIYSELFQGLRMGGGYFQFQAPQLRLLPIRTCSSAEQKQFSHLVEKMTSLNEQLAKLADKQSTERNELEAEIARTDREIDELVYKLYGITEEEKKIIEESLT